MPLLDDNDATRMTRHQLAARIEQMEATANRNSTVGANNDRHRPMEDRRRREKIGQYKAELARKIGSDELAEIERQRYNAELAKVEERAKQQSAHDSAAFHRSIGIGSSFKPQAQRIAESIAQADAREPKAKPRRSVCYADGCTAWATVTEPEPLCAKHAAELAKTPASVQAEDAAPAAIACTRCGVEQTQNPNHTQNPHVAVAGVPCPAGPTEYSLITDPAPSQPQAQAQEKDAPMRYYESFEETRAQMWEDSAAERGCEEEAQENRQFRRDTVADQQTDPPSFIHNGQPARVIALPVIAPDTKPVPAVVCPQCGASATDSCRNYKGQRCATHGARRKAAQAAGIESYPERETARPEPTPAPPPTAAAIAPDPAAQHDPDPNVAREAAARATSSDPDGRRPGHSRKHYPSGKTEATEEREFTNAQVRALIAEAKPKWKHDTDADLEQALSTLLLKYTLGTVIDACWAVERAMFAERNTASR